MKTLVRLGLVTILSTVNFTAARASGPTIQSIEPSEGKVGQSIKLTGTNLQKTQSIDFLVGKTFRRAKFQIASKTQVDLVVPEVLRPNAEALILLYDNDSVSFTCPVTEIVVREDQPIRENRSHSSTQVFHVLQGGVLPNSSMPTIVEKHGLVSQVTTSPVILVKEGGMIGKCTAHGPLTIFYEEGAQLSFDAIAMKWPTVDNSRRTVAGVTEIHVAEGVGPFVFRPLPRDARLSRAQGPAEIQSIEPVTASPGDIVTVKGQGFCGTTEVYTVTRSMHPAGFQIVSDNLLKVEIPETVPANACELIVINSKGLSVTRSPVAEGNSSRLPARPATRNLVEVTDGMVLTSGQVNLIPREAVFLVNEGGSIASPQFSGVFLVKSGGKIVNMSVHCFHEQGASIPAASKSKLVDAIFVNDLPVGLRISQPTPWKP